MFALLAVLLAAAPATAQSDAARAAARDLGTEGVEAFQAGRFSEAVDKLERAFKVVRAPSVGLWSARALIKTDKWVEASERLLEVTRLDPSSGDVGLQKKALADAAKEREELLPRIPALLLVVRGASPSVELTLDGTALPAALVGTKVPVNPGTHEVVARDGARQVRQQVSATEGKLAEAVLDFEQAPSAAAAGKAAPPAATPPATPPAATATSAEAPKAAPSRIPLGTWVALGVGVAGVAVGATTGLMASGKKSDLESSCRDTRCDPAKRDEIDSYNSLRTVSTVGFVVGAVGLAAGGVIYLIAPAPKKQEGALAPFIGLGAAGVRGSF